MESEHAATQALVMKEIKAAVAVASQSVKAKHVECDDLVRYQEEFRDEYIRVCAHRDDLQRNNDTFAKANDALYKDIDRYSKSLSDLKANLSRVLEIQDHEFS